MAKRAKKKTEEQMQLFSNGGTSQKDKAEAAFKDLESLLSRGITEQVTKTDNSLISNTYKDSGYAAEDVLKMLKAGDITLEQAEKFLKKEKKSGNYAVGGLEEGGLRDQGGSIDPVSGNDVPSGSTQSEVRDDIPAQLSEGEFVLPADVVRYIGLENLMELRNKAKQGLQQMEDMGQMGNSDEATMSDTASMEVDIDSMIDAFDPNDPATMEFNTGGLVYADGGAVADPLSAFSKFASNQPVQPVQPVPPVPPVAAPPPPPPIPQAFSAKQLTQGLIGGPTASPVSYTSKDYIGPSGERISIKHINGKPMQEPPLGFVEFDPSAEAKKAPKIEKPTVAPTQGDSMEEREREKEDKDRMDKTKATFNTLAEANPAFAEVWGKDPFNTGIYENPYSAASKSIDTVKAVNAAIEATAKEYGIDLAKFTNSGFASFTSKYKDDAYAEALNEAISDPRAKEKAAAQREVSRGDYNKTGGTTLSDEEAQAQYEEDLDEVADGVDRNDLTSPTTTVSANTVNINNTSSTKSDGGYESTRAETAKDAPPDGAFFKKGGLASPKVKTKRKPKMKRGGLASKK